MGENAIAGISFNFFFLSSYCICSLEVEAERKSGWKFAVQGLSHEYERMTKIV